LFLLPLLTNLAHGIDYTPEGCGSAEVEDCGSIVEIYPTENLDLVEFADLQGQEYAIAILSPDKILAIHYELAVAGLVEDP
jgi:hypothetical protein